LRGDVEPAHDLNQSASRTAQQPGGDEEFATARLPHVGA
jgi:hypothetical protein